MSLRRTLLSLAAVAAVAACGADGSSGEEDALPAGVVFRADATVDVGIGSGSAADVPDPPAVVVTDDGHVVLPAPPSAAVAGELLPTMWTLTITPRGVERLLAAEVEVGSELFIGSPGEHLAQLEKIVGAAELGSPRFYFPEEFLVVAAPAPDVAGRPTVEWPPTAEISLADLDSCRAVPEIQVGEALATAAAGSVFDDGGRTFDVAAVPAWPGAAC